MTLEALRRLAVGRSLFPAVALQAAVDRLGFVQADPIRAPARAQDLVLRHRVTGYRAGELERRYAELGIEEDVFVNYGFVSPAVHALMHPRAPNWPPRRAKRARAVLDFVRARREVHPREVDEHFPHGRVTNYWGGSSNATTRLLELMHYRGLLRVVRRERGIRIYAAREAGSAASNGHLPPALRVDALIDVAVAKYAPLPAQSLRALVGRLRYAVPQWRTELRPALSRALSRLAQARVDGNDWYWPSGERPSEFQEDDAVRLLAPFDPVVWDRRRFELFWGWSYRFEAYTPAGKRRLGYYALPLLWRDRIIGWGNVSIVDGALRPDLGFVAARPRDRAFRGALDAELDRMRRFLGVPAAVNARGRRSGAAREP